MPSVRPEVVFFVFLPPLTYAAAFGSSTQDLAAHARPIGILSVGLVLATMGVAATVAHLVAGFAWGPAMVLGAILAPTDPIAATSVLRRLGAPERASTILEGEAMINDGTGLTVYKLAVAAVVSGHFSIGRGAIQFVLISAGGVAVGLIAGWVSAQLRRRIDEPRIEISISLLTAYLAYIPADRLGVSGILASVTAGLYTGRRATWFLSPNSRLHTLAFWEVLTFLLESVLFLLIGLQVGHLARALGEGIGAALWQAVAVTVSLMLIRMTWMFVVPALVRAADPRNRREPPATRSAELVVLGWAGLRGGVSLAAALAIPLTAQGQPFPARNSVIFIAYVAIVATLLIPGLTLPWLVHRLGLGETEQAARAESRARLALAQAGLLRIAQEEGRGELPEWVLDQLRSDYEYRMHRLEPLKDGEAAGNGRSRKATGDAIRRLRRDLIRIERARLQEIRQKGEISADIARRLQRELDLDESRLEG